MSNLNRQYWYELLSSDPDASARFYGAVVGFATQAWPDPAMAYTLLLTPSGPPAGGLMALPKEMADAGVPPHWGGVIAVADTDAVVAKVTAAGGSVLAPPMDIPGVGRYASCADPQGASFGVMQSADGEGESAAEGAVGTVGWNELWTSDPAAAVAFYGAVFGWQQTDTMDMGPESGTYHMLTPSGGTHATVGVAKLMPGQPHPSWLYYFVVPSADAAVEKVTAAGGKAIMPIMDVPGGGRAGVFIDAQGVHFGLFSMG